MVADFPITLWMCCDESSRFVGFEIEQPLGEGKLTSSVTPAHPGPRKQALHASLVRTQIFPLPPKVKQ